MATVLPPSRAAHSDRIGWLQDNLPKLVLAPSFAAVLVCVYGFIIFTLFLSFTNAKLLPTDFTEFVGLSNYVTLFEHRNWKTSLTNLAIFAPMYIIICTVIGLGLAILLDQKIRIEGVLRPFTFIRWRSRSSLLASRGSGFSIPASAWKPSSRAGLGNLLVPLDQGQ